VCSARTAPVGCPPSPVPLRAVVARWRHQVGRRRLRQLRQSPEWTIVEASLLLAGPAGRRAPAPSSIDYAAETRGNNRPFTPESVTRVRTKVVNGRVLL